MIPYLQNREENFLSQQLAAVEEFVKLTSVEHRPCHSVDDSTYLESAGAAVSGVVGPLFAAELADVRVSVAGQKAVAVAAAAVFYVVRLPMLTAVADCHHAKQLE
jgi:hypothetical protein